MEAVFFEDGGCGAAAAAGVAVEVYGAGDVEGVDLGFEVWVVYVYEGGVGYVSLVVFVGGADVEELYGGVGGEGVVEGVGGEGLGIGAGGDGGYEEEEDELFHVCKVRGCDGMWGWNV
mgnify:CR=1 FL=1